MRSIDHFLHPEILTYPTSIQTNTPFNIQFHIIQLIQVHQVLLLRQLRILKIKRLVVLRIVCRHLRGRRFHLSLLHIILPPLPHRGAEPLNILHRVQLQRQPLAAHPLRRRRNAVYHLSRSLNRLLGIVREDCQNRHQNRQKRVAVLVPTVVQLLP